MYARLDLLPSGLDGETYSHGTTNVEAGPQFRLALAQVRRRDPLRLAVGADAVTAATLTVLATSGQIGYDVAEAAYFHRSLPFDAARVERANPRLAAARALIEQGGVRLHTNGASVTSGPNTYDLRPEGTRLHCTCQWWAENGGQRGPCKHELAVRIHQHSAEPAGPLMSPAGEPSRGSAA